MQAGRKRFTPYQTYDPNPTKQINTENENKEKTVDDKKGASSSGQ